MNASTFSKALVLYCGYGLSSAPLNASEVVVDTWGEEEGRELLSRLASIFEEVNRIAVDWSALDLYSAGKYVRDTMHQRHPEIEDEALDAIDWKFTYDWR